MSAASHNKVCKLSAGNLKKQLLHTPEFSDKTVTDIQEKLQCGDCILLPGSFATLLRTFKHEMRQTTTASPPAPCFFQKKKTKNKPNPNKKNLKTKQTKKFNKPKPNQPKKPLSQRAGHSSYNLRLLISKLFEPSTLKATLNIIREVSLSLTKFFDYSNWNFLGVIHTVNLATS